jgi:hypothetical protein
VDESGISCPYNSAMVPPSPITLGGGVNNKLAGGRRSEKQSHPIDIIIIIIMFALALASGLLGSRSSGLVKWQVNDGLCAEVLLWCAGGPIPRRWIVPTYVWKL